jgi:hypothetical protein
MNKKGNAQASRHECLYRCRKLAFQIKEENAVTEFFNRPTGPPCKMYDNMGACRAPCPNVQRLSLASVVERIRFPENQVPA